MLLGEGTLGHGDGCGTGIGYAPSRDGHGSGYGHGYGDGDGNGYGYGYGIAIKLAPPGRGYACWRIDGDETPAYEPLTLCKSGDFFLLNEELLECTGGNESYVFTKRKEIERFTHVYPLWRYPAELAEHLLKRLGQ